jgi:rhomboid protease GluP
MFIRRESFKQYTSLYPVVSTLLAINLIVYILSVLPSIGDQIIGYGLAFNAAIAAGEWWRLITAVFLHGGITHIIFNMFSLFVFAPELEKMVGRGKFLLIYFAAGIGGNILTFVLQDSFYASLGASGAIFGVFGAYLGLVAHTRNRIPQLKQVILPIVIVSIVMTFLSSNINITAHLGGMAIGFILGYIIFRPKTKIRAI